MQLLKTAKNLKPSQVVAKGIKLLEKGEIERVKGTLYGKNETTGKCQMCVDGLFIRFYNGSRVVKGYNGCGQPPHDLMQHIGLNEKVSLMKAQELENVFKSEAYTKSYYYMDGLPIYQVLYVANDNGVSWNKIQTWLESLGK